ncbi:MAG TPA: hypothetical protein VIJ21_02165 [Solirubrobacterales bacterium]
MEHRLPARSTGFGVAATLMLSLILCLLLIDAGRGEAAGAPAKRNCSTAGLVFTVQRGGATFSDGVSSLRAQVVTCQTARSLASQVARDILRETKVPSQIAGLKVTLKEPCAGCTPTTSVVAKSGERAVIFTVRGGV